MKRIYYEPEYVSKFICDGTICNASCCKNWQIEIDSKAANRYRKINSHIANFKDGHYYINFNSENACPFLNEKSLCKLQIDKGEKFLSGTCRTFPRRTYFIDEFCERTLSLACPLAAKLALNGKINFVMNETDDETDVYNPNVPEELIDYLLEIQMTGVHILQEQRLKIDQRLIILGYYLDRIDELILEEKFDEIEKVSALYKSENFLIKQVPMLLKNIRYDEEIYFQLMNEVFEKADLGISPNYESKFKNDQVLENYLVNEFFGNIYPYRTKEPISQNYGLFVLTYKIFEALITEDKLIEIVTWFSRNIDHDVEYFRWLQTKTGLDVLKIMKILHNH